jgi:hypothetical protein
MDVMHETRSLISAHKVSGAKVYNAAGDDIGVIREMMLDKRSGVVAHAIMTFGGFLGIGEKYHPIPWPLLKYDTGLDGYVVDLTGAQLKAAPAYEAGEDPGWANKTYSEQVYGYYDAPPYWELS